MRFPRISRLRWDKKPAEADRLETLEQMLRAEGASSVRPLARAGAGVDS
jgi:DNA ligase-1